MVSAKGCEIDSKEIIVSDKSGAKKSNKIVSLSITGLRSH